MTERQPGSAPADVGDRRAQRLALALLAAGALTGCAIPFGGSPDSEGSSWPTLKEGNSLYLQDQDLRNRQRQNPWGELTTPER